MAREITDEEYNWLQGRRQVADFVESIYNDPVLSKEAKALVKKKYPQLQIPDYDIEDRFDKKLAERDKADADAKAKAKEDEDNARFQKDRDRVQKEYGFTDDGMKELENFMRDKNVLNYDVAAEYHASKNPKQAAVDHSDGLWNHQKQDGFADISKDPEGWARREILGAIRGDQERQRGGR